MTIAFLASGMLGYECLAKLAGEFQITSVFTDSNSTLIRTWAEENAVECFVGNPRNDRAGKFIEGKRVDVLFSVNYIFLLEQEIIDWPAIGAFNIHGSLLPKYRGRTPHVWAIINNESEAGATIHLIDKGCDTGPVVMQRAFPILPEATGGDIVRHFETLFPEMIKECLQTVDKGFLRHYPQDESKATYFSKRTPESGLIDWNWQRERIYNWIRAQARPYPGAFSFFQQKRVIIHKAVFSDHGFKDTDPNGLILSTEDEYPIVKTPNGALKIVDFETENNISLSAGNFFRNE